MDDWLEIGTVVSAQGLLGEVRVYPDSDFPERFEIAGERWLLPVGQSQPQAFHLISGRYLHGKGLYVLKFAGIDDRAQAESLKGSRLVVLQSDRPPLKPGEFHLHDLVGLKVFLQSSQELIGEVVAMATAGNDLLEVKLLTLPHQTILVPLVKEIVPLIDLANHRLEINPPPGLLPEPVPPASP